MITRHNLTVWRFLINFSVAGIICLGLLPINKVYSAPLKSGTDDFLITVRTGFPGMTSDTQFQIPVSPGPYIYNYNVDCDNDGTFEGNGRSTSYTCNYPAAGTYTIRIEDNSGAGTGFPRINFSGADDPLKLIAVNQWGATKWVSMENAFSGCNRFNGPAASDTPDLSNVTSMKRMFETAWRFNQDIGSWDTSNVTDMSFMFFNAYDFNQNIGSWDTSNVTTMRYMFWVAEDFNGDISGWDTSNVTDMHGLFLGADSFNQNIGGWNTSNVTDMAQLFNGSDLVFNQDIGAWITSNVTDMEFMFYMNSAFNQDISTWNTGSVADMDAMFHGATAFDQNLGNWDVSALTTANNAFSGVKLSTANYDSLLTNWNGQTLQTGVNFSGGNSNYCAGEAARANMITSDSWVISDGGKHCGMEIDIQRPFGTSIVDGGTDNIGGRGIGPVNLTYTIANVDVNQLDVTGLSVSNLVNVSNYSNSTSFPLNILGGNTGTVDISFDVDAVGTFSFDLDFASNDDNENPYDITVSGIGSEAPHVVFGASTFPADGSTLAAGPVQITVEFDMDVASGGGTNAADYINNFLLIEAGNNGVFDTNSCAVPGGGNAALDDVEFVLDGIVYNGADPFISTLNINNGNKLPDGLYRLYICGTTSIENLVGIELNDGTADSILNFTVSQPVRLPDTGFKPGRKTLLPEQPGEKLYTSSDLFLEIPSLGISIDIVGVPVVEEEWDVTWLHDQAGWLSGTAYPSYEGNSVVTAHVYLPSGLPGPFVDLEKMDWDDTIIVHAFGYRYIYQVRSNQIIDPEDSSAIRHEEYSWLTLLTCKNYNENKDAYNYRVMVRAVLVEVRPDLYQ